MLTVTFHNINEKDNVADYDVEIYVNHRKIAEEEILGHHRGTGWEGLIQDFAKQLKEEPQ